MKKILALILATILCLSLVACGGAGSNENAHKQSEQETGAVDATENKAGNAETSALGKLHNYIEAEGEDGTLSYPINLGKLNLVASDTDSVTVIMSIKTEHQKDFIIADLINGRDTVVFNGQFTTLGEQDEACLHEGEIDIKTFVCAAPVIDNYFSGCYDSSLTERHDELFELYVQKMMLHLEEIAKEAGISMDELGFEAF